MSDILENIKDAVNPKRREKATPPDYDPKTRGAYADEPPATGQAGLSAPTNTDPSTAPDRSPKLATNTNLNAPEGTFGPHESRVANALDPRVDSDRDGRPSHGISDYGGAAANPAK